MNTTFHVYNPGVSTYTSTIFDLFSGNKEVQQTKGLAYILAEYPELVFMIIGLPEVSIHVPSKLKNILRLANLNLMSVSAEMYTVAGQRADIVCKIDTVTGDRIALVIEAKNINVTASAASIQAQLSQYLVHNAIPVLNNYDKIGIALTKYNYPLQQAASLQWSTIIGLLLRYANQTKTQTKTPSNSCRCDSKLLNDFIHFLIRAGQSMHFYEREVLSVPAGGTIQLIQTHFVYATPVTAKYNYKRTQFITFRAKGGAMTELYRIEDVIVFDPSNPAERHNFMNSAYPNQTKTQIDNYINAAMALPGSGVMSPGTQRFFVLSQNVITLPRPFYNPGGPGLFTAYYDLDQVIQAQAL